MDYDKLLEHAGIATAKLNSGRIFVLKDLFQGTEWDSLERGVRIQLGKVFKNAVNDGKITEVEFIGKAPNNSTQYKKL